jgi:nucleoside phosphorylase
LSFRIHPTYWSLSSRLLERFLVHYLKRLDATPHISWRPAITTATHAAITGQKKNASNHFTMSLRRLRVQDYTVGWFSALPIELAAATVMLDEKHESLPHDDNDPNLYTLGSIGNHNVVLACLPAGQIGTNSAAAVATRMQSNFPSIRVGLMVGIGGGVPSAEADVRLGDVVISQPHAGRGGVVQYDSGKTGVGGRLTPTSFLNTPPTVLLNAISQLQSDRYRGQDALSKHFIAFEELTQFSRDSTGPDVLYEASYNHIGGPTCDGCREDKTKKRTQRASQKVVIHYGTIASGNQVIKDGVTRDRLSAEGGGVLCFEMEAAGLMNSFPCLVIRGICDYADSHKNRKWQPYAAAVAAACAKEVLLLVPASETSKPCIEGETTRRKEGTSMSITCLSL